MIAALHPSVSPAVYQSNLGRSSYVEVEIGGNMRWDAMAKFMLRRVVGHHKGPWRTKSRETCVRAHCAGSQRQTRSRCAVAAELAVARRQSKSQKCVALCSLPRTLPWPRSTTSHPSFSIQPRRAALYTTRAVQRRQRREGEIGERRGGCWTQ